MRVTTGCEVAGAGFFQQGRQARFDPAANPRERFADGGGVHEHLGLIDIGEAVVVVRRPVEAVEAQDFLFDAIHVAKYMHRRPLLFADVAVFDGERQLPDGHPV